MCQSSGKTNNFNFLGPNLPKNGFFLPEFQKPKSDFESAPPRYHVCQFSGKADNFDFFGPNLSKKEFTVGKRRKLILE